MMCPLVVARRTTATLRLAAGSAGASRIRTALLGTLLGVLVDGLDTCRRPIAAPRFHAVDDARSTSSRDYPDAEELAALADAGYTRQPLGPHRATTSAASAPSASPAPPATPAAAASAAPPARRRVDHDLMAVLDGVVAAVTS